MLEEVLAEEDPWREAWNTQVAVLIGASIDENIWAIEDFFCPKMTSTFSECLVLPIIVFLAVAAYATVAAIFYNTDGWIPRILFILSF